MNADKILKIIDAGYTKIEIDQMSFDLTEQTEAQTKDIIEVVPAEETKEEATTIPEKSDTEKRLEKIEDILSQIAANGIASSKAPEPTPKRNVVKEILEHL